MSLTQLRNLGIVTNAGISTTKLGAGAVLQVTQITSGISISTSSTSFVTTGIEHSITPSSASNKILIMIQGYGGTFNFVSAQTTYLAIFKGATQLYTSSCTFNSNNNQANSFSLIFLDSPATTSSTTYTLRFRINGAGATAEIRPDGISETSVLLMEIKG